MPKIIEYTCLNCQKHVRKSNTLGKYCSNKCQKTYERNEKVKNNTASSHTVKVYLIENNEYSCSECGISTWNDKPIVLEIEHKNGNPSDNSLENVCLLCPNCHSQTNTYKGKNKGNGRHNRKLRYQQGLSY